MHAWGVEMSLWSPRIWRHAHRPSGWYHGVNASSRERDCLIKVYFAQDGKESSLQGCFSRRLQQHLELSDDHTRGRLSDHTSLNTMTGP